jgi:transglutaminase-like putative cysteine protease
MKQQAKKSKYYRSPVSPDAQLALLLSLGLAVIPHVTRLPVWMTLFASGILIYKLATLRYAKLALPKPVIVILGVMVVGSVSLHFSTIFGRDAGVCLLIGMLFIKLLETRQYRDAMVMIALSYFVILTNLLYTQSIPTVLYMLLVVFIITVALVTINSSPGIISWREKLRIALPLILFALPLMFLLFILFPRIPGPIWGLPQDVYSARSGMSDTMSPGSVSQLALSDEVVFRVSFNGEIPPKQQLYWRALVLSEYDGRTWRIARSGERTGPQTRLLGTPTEYTVTLEPHQQRWLFGLDIPAFSNRNIPPAGLSMKIDSAGLLFASNAIVSMSQYRLNSYTEYVLSPTLSNEERNRNLQLPAYNPRTAKLAQHWRTEGLDSEQIIARALNLFYTDFTYTLRPPVPGQNVVDEFLFSTKRGFCEHFAGAFTVLMRSAGIPARVVVGYQGGELNPIGNYMLVRQADAHAWTEVWLNRRGWVRIDPTGAVSPARIERGLDQAIPVRDNPRMLLRRNSPLIAKIDLIWDSINNRWNGWILGYGPEMQKLFMQYLGMENVAAYRLIVILTITLAISLAVIAIISFRQRRPVNRDHAQLIYQRLCRKLGKAGFKKNTFDGASTYLKAIEKDNAPLGRELVPIFDLYIDLRYRRHGKAMEDTKRLKHMVQQFQVKKPKSAA